LQLINTKYKHKLQNNLTFKKAIKSLGQQSNCSAIDTDTDTDRYIDR